jgi:hypothetical protein
MSLNSRTAGIVLLTIATLELCSAIYTEWVGVAAALLFASGGLLMITRKASLFSSLALAVITAGIALIPHLVFLVLYNMDVKHTAVVNGIKAEPALLGLALRYEDAVLAAHNWFEAHLAGWRLWLVTLVEFALVVALAYWRLWAAEAAVFVRRVSVAAQMFLVVAASITVIAKVPSGEWNPDFRPKLKARLAELERVREQNWSLEAVPPAVQANADPIRSTYGPALGKIDKGADGLPQLSDGDGSPTSRSVLIGVITRRTLGASGVPNARGDTAMVEGLLDDDSSRATSPSEIRVLDHDISVEAERTAMLREQAVESVVEVLAPVPVSPAIAREFANAFVTDALNEALRSASGRATAVVARSRMIALLGRVQMSGSDLLNSVSDKIEVLVANGKSVAFRTTFLKGVNGGWVLSENPQLPGKLFIHESETANELVNMLYTVEVENDGSWIVYAAGTGEKVGTISANLVPDVHPEKCDCE